MATLLLYGGEERRYASDAKRIFKQLERYHESPDKAAQGELPTLLEFGPETELQGSEWLKQAGKKAGRPDHPLLHATRRRGRL